MSISSPKPHDTDGVLRTVAATKYFRGVHALVDVTMEVHQGEILGIIGPNGAGKTTLFNVIAGAVKATSGRVYLGSRDITSTPTHRRARLGIARTFQLIKPFGSLSTLDNLVVAATGTGASTREALERAAAIVDELDLKRCAPLDASALNVVEGKRLELARALATKPKVLLLDEIFSGLNADEVATLGEFVGALPRRGITVVLIEHNVSAIRGVTQRVIALEAGSVISEGSPEQVFDDPRVVEAYLGRRASA